MTTRRGFLGLAAGTATALLLPHELQKFFLPPAGGWPRFADIDLGGQTVVTATLTQYGSWVKLSDLALPQVIRVGAPSDFEDMFRRWYVSSYLRQREVEAMFRYAEAQMAAVPGGIPRSALPCA